MVVVRADNTPRLFEIVYKQICVECIHHIQLFLIVFSQGTLCEVETAEVRGKDVERLHNIDGDESSKSVFGESVDVDQGLVDLLVDDAVVEGGTDA